MKVQIYFGNSILLMSTREVNFSIPKGGLEKIAHLAITSPLYFFHIFTVYLCILVYNAE